MEFFHFFKQIDVKIAMLLMMLCGFLCGRYISKSEEKYIKYQNTHPAIIAGIIAIKSCIMIWAALSIFTVNTRFFSNMSDDLQEISISYFSILSILSFVYFYTHSFVYAKYGKEINKDEHLKYEKIIFACTRFAIFFTSLFVIAYATRYLDCDYTDTVNNISVISIYCYILYEIFRIRTSIASALNSELGIINDSFENFIKIINDNFVIILISMVAVVLFINIIENQSVVSIPHFTIIKTQLSVSILQLIACFSMKYTNKYVYIFNKKGISAKLNADYKRYLLFFCKLVISIIYCFILYIIICEIFKQNPFWKQHGNTEIIVWDILIVLISFLFYKIFHLHAEYKIEHAILKNTTNAKRLKTFMPLIIFIVKATLSCVLATVGLGLIGINIFALIASFGVFGSTLLIVSKDTLNSFLSGVISLLEEHANVGDCVSVCNITGIIEKISLRGIFIRQTSGALTFVPHTDIKIFTNLSLDYKLQIFDIVVNPTDNLEKIKQIILSVANDIKSIEEFRGMFLGDLQIFGIKKFDENGVKIVFGVKTLPDNICKFEFAFFTKLKDEFDKNAISIQFGTPVYNTVFLQNKN